MTDDSRRFYTVEPENEDEWLRFRDPSSPQGLAGIGSSEAAAALGKNPYRTQLELWEEKTGLRPPFSGNEATERGKENEGATRERFSRMNASWCRVSYHQFRMYVSKELPLFTTLDGEMTVTEGHELTCLDAVTGRPAGLMLRKGMRGILEIKDSCPRTEKAYNSWNTVPEMYRFQLAAQLRATAGEFSFSILVARLTGEWAENGEEYRTFGLFPEELAAETAMIEEGLPSFWDMVRTKRQPGVAMFDEKSLTLVQLQPEVRPGNIIADFDGVRESVERYASQFEGMTFGDDELKKAKEARAELNKYSDSLNRMRLAVARQWNAPLDEFKSRVDGLRDIIVHAREPIEEHIRKTEEERKEARKARIYDVLASLAESFESEHPDEAGILRAMGGIPFVDRWLNATCSMKAVTDEANGFLDRVLADTAAIASLASGDSSIHQSLLQEYCRTGNVNDAISAMRRIEAARESAREAEKRRQQEAEAAPATGSARPEPASTPDEAKASAATVTVRFSHTDMGAFRELLAFMKERGFQYVLVRQ